MRRRSQILMFLLLVVGGFCALSTVARADSYVAAAVSSLSHRSTTSMAQVGAVESEDPIAFLAEESLDSVTGKISLACSNSTTELAVVNSLFSVLLDCPRGGGQFLVNRHVRLQI